MDNQHFVRIHEKSETRLINLAHVTYVVIQEARVAFHFVDRQVHEFTNTNLEQKEFDQLKRHFEGLATIASI